MKQAKNYDIKIDVIQLWSVKIAFVGSILLLETAIRDLLNLLSVQISPIMVIIMGAIPALLLMLTLGTKCFDKLLNNKGVERAGIFCSLMACIFFYIECMLDVNNEFEKPFSIIIILFFCVMIIYGTGALIFHKYDMSEKNLLKKLNIEDFSQLTRDSIINIAFMLKKTKREVAAKALTHFSDFGTTITNLMMDYKNSLNNCLKKDEVSSSLIDSVISQADENDPSLDKRFYIIEKMREISDRLEENQLEHSKFIYALWAIGMHALYGITVSLEPMISAEDIHTIVIVGRKYYYKEKEIKLEKIIPTIVDADKKCFVKINGEKASSKAYDSLINQLDNANIIYIS